MSTTDVCSPLDPDSENVQRDRGEAAPDKKEQIHSLCLCLCVCLSPLETHTHTLISEFEVGIPQTVLLNKVTFPILCVP